MDRRRKLDWRATLWAGVVGIGGVGAWITFAPHPELAIGAITTPRTTELISVKLKFDGAAGCSAAKCHGGATANPPDKRPQNEYVVWSGQDQHAKAWETLSNKDSKEIAQKLRLANASVDPKCVTCHALNPPAAQQGNQFNVHEGVTCNACHGPSEKWEKPHEQAGWTDQARQNFKANPLQMLTQVGLYDTKSPLLRAEMCTSCHLAIGTELVAAGHPQPRFEMEYFSAIQPKHWRDPEGYPAAGRWAIGQAVCVRDAMRQLSERGGQPGIDPKLLREAYDQAMAHLMLLRQYEAVTAPAGVGAWDAKIQQLRAAMTANNAAPIVAAADATAAQAEQAFATVSGTALNKASVVSLLGVIGGDATMGKEFGDYGREQQAYALYSLYTAYAAAEHVPAQQSGAVSGAIVKLMPPSDKPPLTAEQYAPLLTAAKAQLPTQ